MRVTTGSFFRHSTTLTQAGRCAIRNRLASGAAEQMAEDDSVDAGVAGDRDDLRLAVFDEVAPARQHARGEVGEALAAGRTEIGDVAPARRIVVQAAARRLRAATGPANRPCRSRAAPGGRGSGWRIRSPTVPPSAATAKDRCNRSRPDVTRRRRRAASSRICASPAAHIGASAAPRKRSSASSETMP